MRSKETYQKMMEEVHAPESLFRSVAELRAEKSANGRKAFWKTLGGAAAAFAFFLAASNGICYAALGQTWIVKAIVCLDDLTPTAEYKVTANADGSYELELVSGTEPETDAPTVLRFFIDPAEDLSDTEVSYSVGEYAEETETMPAVVSENGRIYLCYADEKIDITDDLTDGKAEGSIAGYRYTVTADGAEYVVSLQSE